MRYQISTQSVGNTIIADNTYMKSGNNYTCFYQSVLKEEITNPTNYDMNVIVYDIIYKDDCPYLNCYRSYFEDFNSNSPDASAENSIGAIDTSTNTNGGDPISLIHRGLTNMQGLAASDSQQTSYIVEKNSRSN